jgi:hypothetical protein
MTSATTYWREHGLIGRVAMVVVAVVVLWLLFFVISVLLGSSSASHGVG